MWGRATTWWVQSPGPHVKLRRAKASAMSERDLTVPRRDEIAEWDGATGTREMKAGEKPKRGLTSWVGMRLDVLFARLLEGFGRRASKGGDAEPVALARTGGPIARWISFPRSVRAATAATSTAAAAMAAWGVLAMAGN